MVSVTAGGVLSHAVEPTTGEDCEPADFYRGAPPRKRDMPSWPVSPVAGPVPPFFRLGAAPGFYRFPETSPEWQNREGP
jgi:hypothetical protein